MTPAERTAAAPQQRRIHSDLDHSRVPPYGHEPGEAAPDSERPIGDEAGYTMDSERRAAEERRKGRYLHPEMKEARAPAPSNNRSALHTEELARQHQIDEERRIDRHSDWENQVQRDKKYPTSQK
jgi:hypothetical protein